MPTVFVVGSEAESRTLPGSGHYVDVPEIRRETYDDLNRVLRRVPGVYVRPEDGYGLFPNVSLRGVDTTRSAKVTLMEDGVLAAPAAYSAPSAYYSPTTGRMSGIEVLKGSSQIRYGPHTTGGVINYVSTPVPDEPTIYAKAIYGRHTEYRVHAYAGDTMETDVGRLGFLFEAYQRETNGFKRIDATPDFSDRNRTGFEKTEPMVKVVWEPPTATYHRFEFKAGHTDLDADETYLGLSEDDFDDDPVRRYSATRFDNIDTEHDRYHLRHYVEFSPDVDLTTTWYYANFDRDWFKLNDVTDASGTRTSLSRALAAEGSHLQVLRGQAAGELRVRHNAREYWSRGVEGVMNWRFETGDVSHTVTAGLRRHFDKVRRNQFNETFEQNADGTLGAHTVGEQGEAGDRRQKTHARAAFVQDRVEWDRWAFVPGFRVEKLKQDHDDFNDPTTDGRNDMTVSAAGLGVVYRWDEEWTFFGGVYEGYSVPSPRAAVKDDLDEETSLGWELGARYRRRDGALAVEATLFRTDMDDLIVIDNVGGAGTGESENVGETTSVGLEFLVRYDAGIDHGWGFGNPWFLSLTLTDAELDGDANSTDAESLFAGGEDGNDVPYVPDYVISGGTGIEIGRFATHVTASYVDETYTTASNTSDQLTPDGVPDSRFGKTDSYFLVDLSASYRLREGVSLIAGVHNLTDEEYVVSRHPHGPRPGQPRFTFVGFELSF
jgi:Fe(3+) dicitrate transport protein